jgi:hypothetical protein
VTLYGTGAYNFEKVKEKLNGQIFAFEGQEIAQITLEGGQLLRNFDSVTGPDSKFSYYKSKFDIKHVPIFTL